jgi:hypothetical protein
MTFDVLLNQASNQQLFVRNKMLLVVSRAMSNGYVLAVNLKTYPEENVYALESYFIGDNTVMDIADYMRSFVAWVVPALGSNTPAFAVVQTKKFSLDWQVKSQGATVEVGSIAGFFYAFLGGMREEDWQGFNSVLPVLTYQPKNKSISEKQVPFEFLYVSTQASAVQINVTGWRNAGANVNYSLTPSVLNAGENETLICPLSYLFSGLTLHECWRVVVQVVDTVAGVTYNQTYEIDRKSQRHERYFVFENSLGGCDTARFLGESLKEVSAESQQFTQELPYNYTKSSSRIKKTKVGESKSITIETGYKTVTDLDWLATEMLTSNQVFEVAYNSAGEPYLRAIVITTKKLEYNQNSIVPQSAKIEYTYAL